MVVAARNNVPIWITLLEVLMPQSVLQPQPLPMKWYFLEAALLFLPRSSLKIWQFMAWIFTGTVTSKCLLRDIIYHQINGSVIAGNHNTRYKCPSSPGEIWVSCIQQWARMVGQKQVLVLSTFHSVLTTH